uniref:Uncharacterized protein n=1 Tax=Knipowitschia caucasica TaxID=637954 RepID=A0AAV2KN59_KNICA
MVGDHPNTWEEYLQATMFALRTKMQLWPGLQTLGVKQGVALANNSKSQQKRQQKRELTGQDDQFRVGDFVLVKNIRQEQRKGGKLERDMLGPFRIFSLDGKTASLKAPDGTVRKCMSIDHMTPYIVPCSRIPANLKGDVGEMEVVPPPSLNVADLPPLDLSCPQKLDLGTPPPLRLGTPPRIDLGTPPPLDLSAPQKSNPYSRGFEQYHTAHTVAHHRKSKLILKMLMPDEEEQEDPGEGEGLLAAYHKKTDVGTTPAVQPSHYTDSSEGQKTVLFWKLNMKTLASLAQMAIRVLAVPHLVLHCFQPWRHHSVSPSCTND